MAIDSEIPRFFLLKKIFASRMQLFSLLFLNHGSSTLSRRHISPLCNLLFSNPGFACLEHCQPAVSLVAPVVSPFLHLTPPSPYWGRHASSNKRLALCQPTTGQGKGWFFHTNAKNIISLQKQDRNIPYILHTQRQNLKKRMPTYISTYAVEDIKDSLLRPNSDSS